MVEKITVRILTNLQILSPLNTHRKAIFGTSPVCLSVCLQVLMDMLLARTWVGGWISFMFGSQQSVTGQCPVNMNTLSPKVGALQIGPQKQNDFFSKFKSSFLLNDVINIETTQHWR